MSLGVPTKVLIVDDSKNSLIALKAAISDLPVEILLAESGEQALRVVLAHRLAAVVLDVQMPGLDGFTVASLIRERPKYEKTPILFLTGLSEQKDISKGYALGAVDYLIKPVVPEILRAKISVFCDLYEKTVAVERQTEKLEYYELHILKGISGNRESVPFSTTQESLWYVEYLKKFLSASNPALVIEIADDLFARNISGKQLVDIHLDSIKRITQTLDKPAHREVVHHARLLVIGVLAHLTDLYRSKRNLDEIKAS